MMAGGIDVPERPQDGAALIDAVGACGGEDPLHCPPAQFHNVGGIPAELGPVHRRHRGFVLLHCHVEAITDPVQQPAGLTNLGTGFRDPSLHARVFGFHGAIGVPAQVGLRDIVFHAALGNTEDGPCHHRRKPGIHRQAIKGGLGVRTQPHEGRKGRHTTMLGDKRVLGQEVLGPGASHAKRVPGVVDLHVGPGHHHMVDERLIAGGVDRPCAHQEPGGMVAAAAILPAAVEFPAVGNTFHRALGRQRAGDQVVGAKLVDLLLALLGEPAHDVVVGDAHHQHPAGRRADVAQFGTSPDMGAGRHLVATELPGRQHRGQA